MPVPSSERALSAEAVPSVEERRHAIVDLFAGVGCVARGFVRGGPFEAAYLNDIDKSAEQAYQLNQVGDARYDCKDVTEVTIRDVMEASEGRRIAGILGCPPCQGWSAAGGRNAHDPRNALMGNFFQLVYELEPVFVLMENVPAVAGRTELEAALSEKGRKYRWWVGVLNAAAYGLPQSRQRTLVIGYHRSTGVQPTPPAPTHGGTRPVWDYSRRTLVVPDESNIDSILGGAPRLSRGGPRHLMSALYGARLSALPDLVTVEEAIGDLAGRGATAPSAYALRLGADPARTPTGHRPWHHSDDMKKRMAGVPEGGKPRQSPSSGKTYYSQAYARLHRRGLARTVTTNFHNPGSGRFTHYSRRRTLTAREAARLQGFDDDFVLAGYAWHQARLIGNAFPPLWAEVLARHVYGQLKSVFTTM